VNPNQGCVEGLLYPAYFAMSAKWLPKPEKAFMTSLIMFGERNKQITLQLVVAHHICMKVARVN
jgi:hypothetical protein